MASPFMDVLEKMLDENEDDHDNILSDDEQNMDEDQSGDAGECADGGDQDYSQWKWGPVLWVWWRLSLFWTALVFKAYSMTIYKRKFFVVF